MRIADADRVALFTEGMRSDDFRANKRTMFAVERLLRRVAEAAVQIASNEAARMSADPAVDQPRAFGDRSRHEYLDIDPGVGFDVARVDVPMPRSAAA